MTVPLLARFVLRQQSQDAPRTYETTEMHALALTYRLDTNHSSNGTKNNIITFSRFLAPLRPLASSTPPFVAAGTAMALNMPLDIVRVSSSDYKECWNIWIVYTLASDSSSPPPKKIKLSSSDSTHIREIDRNSINAVKKVADGLWSHSQQLLYFLAEETSTWFAVSTCVKSLSTCAGVKRSCRAYCQPWWTGL